MSSTSKSQTTMVAATVKARVTADHSRVAGPASVFGGCLAVAVGAQVAIPVPGTEVPITFQSLAVLLVAFTLQPRRAVAALALYVACGTAGFPVFAPGSLGLAGPTGGFIVGFVLAAWLASLLKGGQSAGPLRLLAAGAVGIGAILLAGVVWRLPWLGWNPGAAIATGLVPFLGKEIVQLLLAVTLLVSIRGARGRAVRKRAL